MGVVALKESSHGQTSTRHVSATLAQRARALVGEKGLSIADVATALDTSRTHIRRLLSGKRAFDPLALERLARLLEVDVAVLKGAPPPIPASRSPSPPRVPPPRKRAEASPAPAAPDRRPGERSGAQELRQLSSALAKSQRQEHALTQQLAVQRQRVDGLERQLAEAMAVIDAQEAALGSLEAAREGSVATEASVRPVTEDEAALRLGLEAENEALRGLLAEAQRRPRERRRSKTSGQRGALVMGGLIGMGLDRLLSDGSED